MRQGTSRHFSVQKEGKKDLQNFVLLCRLLKFKKNLDRRVKTITDIKKIYV